MASEEFANVVSRKRLYQFGILVSILGLPVGVLATQDSLLVAAGVYLAMVILAAVSVMGLIFEKYPPMESDVNGA